MPRAQHNQGPVHTEAKLTFQGGLYKHQVPCVDTYMRDARVFEIWSSKAQCWVAIEWCITPIPVPSKTPYVFIRALGIPCMHFGECLRRWEDTVGNGLPDALKVGDLVKQFLAVNTSAVLWWAVSESYCVHGCDPDAASQDGSGLPEVFYVEDDRARIAEALSKTTTVRKWIPDVSGWEKHTLRGNISPAVWHGVTLLLSDACEIPRGLGDALAALESGSGRDPLQTPSAGYLMKGVSEATQTAGRHTGTLGKRREFEEGSSMSGAKRRRGESQGFGVDEVIDLTE